MNDFHSLTDKDIEKIVKFFQNVKNYELSKGYNIIFLSKRFLQLYYILVEKYPNIRLSNYNFFDEGYSKVIKGKTIFLNDFNYELPKKIGYRDKIFVVNKIYHFGHSKIDTIPYVSNEDIEKANDVKLFMPNKLVKQIKSCTRMTSHQFLDFLSKELNFLVLNNTTNILNLVPDFLQHYYEFIYNNYEPLNYFLHEFYKELLLYKVCDMCDNGMSDITRLKIKNEVIKKMVQMFGKEQISEELVLWLRNDDTSYYNMIHTFVKHVPALTASDSFDGKNNILSKIKK